MPLICIGDFNLTIHEFNDSIWPDRLKVKTLCPDVSSTLMSTSNRIIDFVLVSKYAEELIESVKPIHSVPWGPHIGLLIKICMRPRSVTALVQCIPKALPMDVFNDRWS